MVHVGDSYSPLPDILRQLRKGDVLTHCFTGGRMGRSTQTGKSFPRCSNAAERGVLFDVGDGGPHLSLDVAEKCLQQNFLPDTIGTDLGGLSYNGPVYDLVTELSKFLLLGMSVDQVIERVTLRPTRMFNFGVELGTLRPGAVADITILEVREGSFVFGTAPGRSARGGRSCKAWRRFALGRLTSIAAMTFDARS